MEFQPCFHQGSEKPCMSLSIPDYIIMQKQINFMNIVVDLFYPRNLMQKTVQFKRADACFFEAQAHSRCQ